MKNKNDIEIKFEIDQLFWHELFHYISSSNAVFRKELYKIIHFTVMNKDFIIPKEIYKISI